MEKIKGCIFDLDGVIVDTAKYHYLAWKKIADELGFDFTEEDNEKLKGVSRMDSLEILLQIGNMKFDEETKLNLAEKKNNIYKQYIQKIDKTEILDGVEEFIKELKCSGIKIALGSVSKNAIPIIKSIEMMSYFDSIIDGNKITKAKPDPEVFLLGAKGLNLMPRECIVFEDAEKGIQAAKNAEMYAVGVGNPEILKQADKVIPGFKNQTIEIINF